MELPLGARRAAERGRLSRAFPAAAPCVTSIAVALWSLRHLLRPGAPIAPDVPGHLQRIEFGISQTLSRRTLDGWFPGAMLGYQEYLMYGPGLTWMVAAMRILSVGHLTPDDALKAVTVVAFAAIPAATTYLGRSLGLGRVGAWSSGLLALTASSFRGGGIEGAFGTGLIGQHVAVPLVLLALGSVSRLAAAPTRRRYVLSGCTVAVLLVTHPISALVLAVLAPTVLLAGLVVERPIRPGASACALIAAAAMTVGLAAFWA